MAKSPELKIAYSKLQAVMEALKEHDGDPDKMSDAEINTLATNAVEGFGNVLLSIAGSLEKIASKP